MKICAKCKQEKETSEFYKSKALKDGLQPICKNCDKAYRQSEKGKGAQKKYRESKKGKTQQKLYRKAGKLKSFEKKRRESEEYKKYHREYGQQYRRTKNGKAIQNVHERKRLAKNPSAKIAKRLTSRISNVLKGRTKYAHTLEFLGCTFEELKQHLEKQFISGMTWENYGRGKDKWNIDHIIPCASFNLLLEEEQRHCFHYTNLQPMWSLDNVKKGARYAG